MSNLNNQRRPYVKTLAFLSVLLLTPMLAQAQTSAPYQQRFVIPTSADTQCYRAILSLYDTEPGTGAPPIANFPNNLSLGGGQANLCPLSGQRSVQFQFYTDRWEGARWWRVQVQRQVNFQWQPYYDAGSGFYMTRNLLTDANRDGFIGGPDFVAQSGEYGMGAGLLGGEEIVSCDGWICGGPDGNDCPTRPGE